MNAKTFIKEVRKMKCKKCKGQLNNEQTKENNPLSLCGFCDGTMNKMVWGL